MVVLSALICLGGVFTFADVEARPGDKADKAVCFVTFNASLNRGVSGQLIEDLSTPDVPQAQAVAILPTFMEAYR
jgi:hypothetical protein